MLAPEKLVQTVNDAIASGMISVGDSVVTLDSLMSNWMNETGDGLYALGSVLKTELINNLADAQKILNEMGIIGTTGSISLASSSSLLQPTNAGALARATNSAVSFDAPLLYVNGNVDASVMDDLTKALKEVEQNIYANIAKNLKL